MEQLPQYYSKSNLVKMLKEARPYLSLTYLQVLKITRKGIVKPVARVGIIPLFDLSSFHALLDYVDNPPSVFGKAWKTRKEALGKASEAIPQHNVLRDQS